VMQSLLVWAMVVCLGWAGSYDLNPGLAGVFGFKIMGRGEPLNTLRQGRFSGVIWTDAIGGELIASGVLNRR